jgi:hypothetical protein
MKHLKMVIGVITGFLLISCTSFKYAGIRTVENKPECLGVVSEEIVSYKPLVIEKYPNEESDKFIVSICKEVEEKIQYKLESHQEEIYTKKVLKDGGLEILVVLAPTALGLIAGKDYWYYGVALSALRSLFLLESLKDEFDYRYINGSDKAIYSYEYIKKVKPLYGDELLIENQKSITLNTDGRAEFSINKKYYDTGFRIYWPRNESSYYIKRVKTKSTTTAEWVEIAKDLNLVVGSAVTIVKMINTATAGMTTKEMIIAIIIDQVQGIVIDCVIEILGTKTTEYYDWVLIREK